VSADNIANIYKHIAQLDKNINALGRQSFTNEHGKEILDKLTELEWVRFL